MIFAPCPVCHRMKATIKAKLGKRRLRTHHYRGPDTLLIEVVYQPRCAGSLTVIAMEDARAL